MKRALITGSRGFLGSYLKSMLLGEAFEVIELHSPHVMCDDTRAFNAMDSLRARYDTFDVIFHLAAFIPYGAMNQPDERLQTVNVGLTQELLSAYPNSRFVYASSVAVYGTCTDEPITTCSVPTNVTFYGLSKGAAEEFVRGATSYVIVRYSSIIGPGMKATSMIPKMVNQAMAENRITVYGDGSRMQNYIDVRDAANLMVLSAKSNDNMTVLGIASQEYSNLQVATFIAEETGASIYFEGTDATTGFHYEDRDMHEHIGFKPKFDLPESIRDIIAS